MPQSPYPLDQQIILAHYRRPLNKGRLEGRTSTGVSRNPVCGDQIRLQIQLDGDRIVEAAFEGKGCSISQAAASILTDLLRDTTVEEAGRLADAFHTLLGGAEPEDIPSLGELHAFRSLSRHPVRVPCAYLVFDALELALRTEAPKH